MPYSLFISPCPNDTFAFDAIINSRIPCKWDLETTYLDIEELNQAVLKGIPDISKISYSVLPLISDRYELLDSGSALGRGNGQLLVKRKGEELSLRKVASPGVHTTANALLKRYFPQTQQIKPVLFSRIAEYVEQGKVDAGVLIHEGRFVYQRRDLELVADLGKLWEQETGLPLPLGAIVIKRELGDKLRLEFENLLRNSVEFAFRNPSLSRGFIKEHAQELEDDVIDKHIALFVNQFTISLGEEGRKAVRKLTGYDF